MFRFFDNHSKALDGARCRARAQRLRVARRGYTLIELVVAMGSSAILMAGLASTLYMATRGMVPDATASAETNRSSLALSQLTGDLRLALSFTERTAKAVTFTVPDRTGDGAVDTIRYSWTGTAGDPLLYQFNGGTAVTLASNVQQFNIAALSRTIAASSCVVPGTVVAYGAPGEGKLGPAAPGTSVAVAVPLGLVPGNLMISVVTVDGSVAATLAPGATGWTLVSRIVDSSGQVTTGIWWKIATASEASSYTFSWTGSEQAYGCIMRFSGFEPSAPINASASAAGTSTSASPPCPNVTTTVPNAMIVRIGGFDDRRIVMDNASIVSGYTTITADSSDTISGTSSTDAVCTAAAYKTQAGTGLTADSQFVLPIAQEYVTFTLAIAPDDGL